MQSVGVEDSMQSSSESASEDSKSGSGSDNEDNDNGGNKIEDQNVKTAEAVHVKSTDQGPMQ
jgi:hypothetical protein